MKIFGYEIGKKAEPTADNNVGDVSINAPTEGIMKAYIPEFLYKPPFGYPRKENLPLVRQLAKNPYVFSVIKTLADEASSTAYNIVFKKDVEPTPAMEEVRLQILKFLDNPNQNKESFSHLIRAVVKDIAEVDSGVWVKIFNKKGEFVEMFARDGASFLKNPDIYGYLGNRADYIEPININYATTPESPDWQTTLHQYQLAYKDVAAYFQYGTTAMALPVPFGRKEIVYMMQNPRTDSIYGLSPIQILADIIQSLVYGANYNLDFYMNNNMPEGVGTILGADKGQLTAFRERLDKQFRVKDKITGFMRRVAYKIPLVNQEFKFTPFQLDPKIMQIIEQQQWFTKLVWACFGVTADEMGFTEDSNKAVSQNQGAVHKRKAIKPILQLIKYHIDKEVIPEFGEEAFESLEFTWDDYDLDEDAKKHSLYKQQIDMGIKTPEMVANEEGIDYTTVKEYNDEKEAKEAEKFERESQMNMQRFEEKSLKSLPFKNGTVVKVVAPSKSHGGETGRIREVNTNGEEDYFLVEFESGNDIFFSEELKVVRVASPEDLLPAATQTGPVTDEKVEETEEEKMQSLAIGLKNEETDLEKELVKAVKVRGKELMSALEQLKKGELDRIR